MTENSISITRKYRGRAASWQGVSHEGDIWNVRFISANMPSTAWTAFGMKDTLERIHIEMRSWEMYIAFMDNLPHYTSSRGDE